MIIHIINIIIMIIISLFQFNFATVSACIKTAFISFHNTKKIQVLHIKYPNLFPIFLCIFNKATQKIVAVSPTSFTSSS